MARPSKSLRAAQAAGSLVPAGAAGSDRSSAAPTPSSGTPVAPAPASPLPNATYLHLFSVPLMTYLWPNSAGLNEQLRERILSHAAQDRGVQATNIGGWHSANGELEFLGELREPLFQRMLAMVNEATGRLAGDRGVPSIAVRWSFLGWANISQAGAFNTMHTHPGMTWSGVYYVDTGDSPGQNDSGILKFMDPSPGSAASFLPFLARATPQIQPVAGLMLLFPSYVPHSVLPHRGSRPRISIAFNFRSEPYP
ncbi:MAG TPA: TIGR02466 family protein [Steroidobacteraceae bacterium]|nr:TIGR02466 family protein [Steroidobacteraceae bacterium]